MSYCELCGRQTLEKKRVIVDGTVFNVCLACSKHGKPYDVPQFSFPKKRKTGSSSPRRPVNKISMSDETVLVDDFPGILREARMKRGLTHEQLGMQMNEKAAILKRFETGVLKPDVIFAKKLERHLGIKLYVRMGEDDEK